MKGRARKGARLVHLPGDWPGTLTEDSRGRIRIYLGVGHPAANSGGWTWLPRFIVWRATGEVLRPDEHVHHECQHPEPLRCTNEDHFRVVTPSYHGQLHASAVLLWRKRDNGGRFEPQPPEYPIPRYGAIMGPAALRT